MVRKFDTKKGFLFQHKIIISSSYIAQDIPQIFDVCHAHIAKTHM